jgi:hypothetical protein
MASASSLDWISAAPGQVGADREDERLARHADRDNVITGRHHVERVAQREQPGGPERTGPGVVVPVVQRDQGHRARPAGQLDVTDEGPGHDFPGEQRGQKGLVRH